MKNYRNILIALFVLFACASQALAQGTLISYQGRLNTNGVPATGVYDFQFYLRDAATAGNSVGATNVLASVGVTNGVFAVILDFGNQFPGSPRWLEIAVRTNGSVSAYTALAPRQPVLPVPFAITASNLSGTLPTAQLSGSFNAANLSGSVPPASLISVPAASLTGSIADARLSTNVALRSGPQAFTGVSTFSNLISSAGGIRLNDSNIWLRGGSDVGHGLAYSGGAVTNFGNGNVQVDGPVLWGYGGGALGVFGGGSRPVLTWANSDVGNDRVKVFGSVLVDASAVNAGNLNPGLVFGDPNGGEGISSKRSVGGNRYGLDFYTAGTNRLSISNDGSINLTGTLKVTGGLVIENRTNDPASPVTGQIWLRTDL